tara:strand:+ start:943 stop:1830 length:888 start_codon:yes stop_codon:yes gene_type:complete
MSSKDPRILPMRSSLSIKAVTPVLQRLYRQFNVANSVADPIDLVRRYSDDRDREVVGFLSAALAFGRVSSVLTSIERLLEIMGISPFGYVKNFDPTRQGAAFKNFRHRWTTGDDLVGLLLILRQIVKRSGTIEKFFLRGYRDDEDDIGEALESFCCRALDLVGSDRSSGVDYFFSKPSGGSGCKRLNLFLRWMVRKDHIDLGVWKNISTDKLIIPLDTHVERVGRCLRLTDYKSPGWAMARDITNSLRYFDRNDPVKYDFSLCHIGMQDLCGFNRSENNERCPLKRWCQPGSCMP